MKIGKTSLFLKDRNALLDTKISIIYQEILDIYVNGIRLIGEPFRQFCYMIDDIGKLMTNVANRLIIDPCLLEQLVYCLGCMDMDNPNIDLITEILGAERTIYREDSKSIILVDGSDEIIIRLDGIQNLIKRVLLPKLKMVMWDRVQYSISTKKSKLYNKTPVTLMQIYNIFNELDKIFYISRFKGLGQMKSHQLYPTCIDPKTRAYFTITSLGDVEMLYALFGVDTKVRKTLLT